MRLSRLPGLFYGVAAFAMALAIWPYFVIFLGNLRYVEHPWVSPSVDVGASVGGIAAVLINVGLIALFGLQHSLMAKPVVKNAILKLVPKDLERCTYVYAANATMIAIVLFWQPIPMVIWDFCDSVWADVSWVVFGLGWLTLAAGASSIDLFEIWGLRQAHAWYRGVPYKELPMKTSWLYTQIRHPHYTGILLGVWSGPYMTVGHVLFAAGFTLYILVGMRHEERGLIRRYGDDYAAYRARTPALFPTPWRAKS